MSASSAGDASGRTAERAGVPPGPLPVAPGPEVPVTAIPQGWGTLLARRGRAQLWACGEALSACDGGEAAAAGLCTYGSGHAVLALAGRFGPVDLIRLRALVPHITWHAASELIIDLSGVRTCSPALVRWIGHLRIRQLLDHGHVELHHCPPEMAAEMTRTGVSSDAVGRRPERRRPGRRMGGRPPARA